jgi:predicted acyl esterase
VRASYRKGFFQKEAIVPGEVTTYAFTVGHTAHCFLPGHRIGVQVCSYMVPMHNRNLNTGEPSTRSAAWAVAHQRVQVGGAWASHVEIPVLPNPQGGDGAC